MPPYDLGELLALANSDPGRAVEIATDLAHDFSDPCDRARLFRCLAVAYRVSGDSTAALTTIRIAENEARRCSDPEVRALTMTTEALIVARMGEPDSALRILDAAQPYLRGSAVGEALVQRSLISLLLGDFHAARDALTDAIAAFADDRRPDRQAAAIMNRAVSSAFLGDLAAAYGDCDWATELFGELEDQSGIASVAHNRAWLRWIEGSAYLAVKEFDQSIEQLKACGFPVDTIPEERCQALLSVGQFSEAIYVAEAGVRALTNAGNFVEAADMRTALAFAYEQTGDLESARTHLRRAIADYRHQTRLAHALRAQVRLLRLSLSSSTADVEDALVQIVGIVVELRRTGNREWLGEAQLLHARALVCSRSATAALAAIRRTSAAGPLVQQIEAHAIRAAAYRELGRPDQVLRSVHKAMKLLADERDLAGAVEVRASMSRLADEIVTDGSRTLYAQNRNRELLDFLDDAEGSLQESPGSVRPPELAEYRALQKAIGDGERELRDVAALKQRRIDIEHLIRRHRLEEPAGRDDAMQRGPIRNTVVRFVEIDNELVAVRQTRRSTDAIALGPINEIQSRFEEASFAIERSLEGRFDPTALQSILVSIDSLIIDPLELGDDDDLVSFMPGTTRSERILAFLPTLQNRVWCCVVTRHSRRSPKAGDRRTVLIEGPNLTSGSDEIAWLADLHPDAEVIRKEAARIDPVLAALEGAGLVHIAAHSEVDAENPMFSNIALADGPLAVYDLLALVKPPQVVVLASCRSSANERVGANAIGLTQGLLSAGIGAVIGTSSVVPDDVDTAQVVQTLHRHLIYSAPPLALRDTRVSPELTPRQRLISQCFHPWSQVP